MAVLASDIMRNAGILLQDEDHIRWTPSELAAWINDAVRTIIITKPSESTSLRDIPLVAGTAQTVPAGTPQAQILLSITRNVRDVETADRAPGRAIMATTRMGLDGASPDWHDPRRVRQRSEVYQYFIDDMDPLRFWVYPGNDGTGGVEAVVSTIPTPVAATGDPSLEASYVVDVGLKDAMATPILDYVIFRAHSKDDVAATAERAQLHFQAFAAAIGLKIANQQRGTPGSRQNG